MGQIPLEDSASETGLLTRVAQTFRMAILAPSEFYTRLVSSTALAQPLIFAFVLVLARIWLRTFWMFALDMSIVEQLQTVAESQGTNLAEVESGLYAMAPFLTPIVIVFQTVVLHVMSRLLGGKAELRKTFQIQAYSYASNVFYLVPYAGDLVAMVVALMVQAAGLRIIHGLSPIRAAIASTTSMAVWFLWFSACIPVG